MDIPADSVVCRPCRQEITRTLADSEYIPRWKKGSLSTNSDSNCCVLNCEQLSIAHANLCSSDQLQSMQVILFKTMPVPVPTPLCKSHYYTVYNALQARQSNCRTCGRRLRLGNDRPCPQPEQIQSYLNEHTDFTGSIVSSDRVCLVCYKSHMAVLKESMRMSTDAELKLLVDSIDTVNTRVVGMAHDIIDIATNNMLMEVGAMLLEHRATLLPMICSNFNKHITLLLEEHGAQEPPELKLMNSRRILCEIKAKYQHHVAYTCKVRRYGTLVYRSSSDIHAVLSEVLWKLHHLQTPKGDEHATCAGNSKEQTDTCSVSHVNNLVHAQIESYNKSSDHSVQDYDEFDADKQIAHIEPQLWNAICCITRSKSEIRGTSRVTEQSSLVYHVKKVRRLFLLCIIMFITDDRCSMPMHTLITDLVQVKGGHQYWFRY